MYDKMDVQCVCQCIRKIDRYEEANMIFIFVIY